MAKRFLGLLIGVGGLGFLLSGCSAEKPLSEVVLEQKKETPDDTTQPTPPQFGAADLSFSLAEPTGVTRIDVAVTGAGVTTPVNASFLPVNGAFGGVISEIPPGTARVFTAEAFRGSEKTCTATASAAIKADSTVKLLIALPCVTEPEEPMNSAPVIHSVFASKTTVATNETIFLLVTASDPDGDPLTYEWDAANGLFSADDITNPTWTAPAFPGAFTIHVVVSDNVAYYGLSKAEELTITVEVPASTRPMATIPQGCFQMGDAKGDSFATETPVHTVCLDSFTLDTQEVTLAAYKACVDAGGCTQPSQLTGFTRSDYYSNAAYANYPVVFVSWNQAKAFCAWEGKRLPTEAEWEYAARGGLEGKRFPWGDTISCAEANYWPNNAYAYDLGAAVSTAMCQGDTVAVDSHPANGYGLYNMAGNVSEWVNDWYVADYSPDTVTNPTGPATGSNRVHRGGQFQASGFYTRVSVRQSGDPATGVNYNIGFRCAR